MIKESGFVENILHKPIIESRDTYGDFELLLTANCPQIAEMLRKKVETTGIDWITRVQRDPYSTSRRDVVIPQLESGVNVVIKKKERIFSVAEMAKAQFPGDKGYPNKLEYFSMSVIHEFRTSILLKELMDKIALPTSLVFNDQEYVIEYVIQKPIGSILSLKDTDLRYVIFEYIPGLSAKDEVYKFGGWNETPAPQRKLYGEIQRVLTKISNQIIEYGLEPWDLGNHQVIYDIDEEKKVIKLGIIDTEEYSFSQRFGDHWPENFKAGLPPVLFFL